MALKAEFKVPPGMEPVEIAKAFSAYLQGPLAFDNSLNDLGRFRNGPYKKNEASDADWQLDSSNDYWLHIRGNEASVSCRGYLGQELVVEAMVALFKARFLRERPARGTMVA